MAAFRFSLQWRKQKNMMGGDDSQLAFDKKVPGEKRVWNAKASSFVAKVRDEVFALLHAIAVKRQVVCATHCLVC
jgi:hypothetical protein